MSKSDDKKKDTRRFWRSMQSEQPPSAAPPPGREGVIDLTTDLLELSGEEREHRLRALRSMLATTKARQEQVLRSRLPALAPGIVIGISSGAFRGRKGTVKDADYIHNRALLDIEGDSAAQWVDFSCLIPVVEET